MRNHFFTRLSALVDGQIKPVYLYPPSQKSRPNSHKARIYQGRRTIHGTVSVDAQARLVFTPNVAT